MTEYKDKHGEEIKAGMEIKHDDGDVDIVYSTEDELGLNATNPDYKGYEGRVFEVYPLHQFDLSEWEIVKK